MLFEYPLLGILPAIMVNQGISQDAVKPGDCRLALEFRFVLDSLSEGGLQNLLSHRMGACSLFKEREKPPVVLKKNLERLFVGGRFGLVHRELEKRLPRILRAKPRLRASLLRVVERNNLQV